MSASILVDFNLVSLLNLVYPILDFILFVSSIVGNILIRVCMRPCKYIFLQD